MCLDSLCIWLSHRLSRRVEMESPPGMQAHNILPLGWKSLPWKQKQFPFVDALLPAVHAGVKEARRGALRPSSFLKPLVPIGGERIHGQSSAKERNIESGTSVGAPGLEF